MILGNKMRAKKKENVKYVNANADTNTLTQESRKCRLFFFLLLYEYWMGEAEKDEEKKNVFTQANQSMIEISSAMWARANKR